MAENDGEKQPGTLNLLERAGAALSPQWGLDRSLAKAKLHQFAAARRSRARGRLATSHQQGSSESWKKSRERLTAMWEAREMEEHFCIISGLLQRLSMYVAGTLEYQPQTGDEAVDKAYADYFHGWCARADVTGRHRFRTLVQLALTGAIRDGEFGFVRRHEGGELRLQAIEADRIGSPHQTDQSETNISGIKINELGRIEAYEIYRRSRTSQYTKEGEAVPKDFMHLYFPNRPDQYHGVSKLAPALPHARDLYELFGHEKIAAKFAASFAALVRKKDPRAPGAMDFDENAPKTEQNSGKFKAEAGTIMTMQDGEEDVQFAPGVQRPSGAFMALVEALIREISLSLVLPYGFVYNMAAFGGVTARLETQAAQRVIRYYQERLEDTILNRVVREVLMWGIATKQIPFSKQWEKGSWQFGQAITGDVGHQTQADLALVAAGVKSRTELASEYGNTFSQVVDTRAAELETIQRVSNDRKIPMELLAQYLGNPTQLFASLERAEQGLPGPDTPPPGMIGSVGEKGVKPLLELLGMVGKGEIDRETAVVTLVNLYGVPAEEAEAMVPEVRQPAAGHIGASGK